MPDIYYAGTDWQCSSGPIITRRYALTDLWPTGLASEIGGGNKDVLAAGDHPVVAIGTKADRPNNLTGVVVTYLNAFLIEVNMASKVVVKDYVSNILTYAQGVAATWAATFTIAKPVYVDDSADLPAGCRLSLSPLNSAGSGNPLAGYLHYDQDEYRNIDIGGPNATSDWPVTADNSEAVETALCIMLVNDSGQAWATIAR